MYALCTSWLMRLKVKCNRTAVEYCLELFQSYTGCLTFTVNPGLLSRTLCTFPIFNTYGPLFGQRLTLEKLSRKFAHLRRIVLHFVLNPTWGQDGEHSSGYFYSIFYKRCVFATQFFQSSQRKIVTAWNAQKICMFSKCGLQMWASFATEECIFQHIFLFKNSFKKNFVF